MLTTLTPHGAERYAARLFGAGSSVSAAGDGGSCGGAGATGSAGVTGAVGRPAV